MYELLFQVSIFMAVGGGCYQRKILRNFHIKTLLILPNSLQENYSFRFGSFEILAKNHEFTELKKLADFILENSFKHIQEKGTYNQHSTFIFSRFFLQETLNSIFFIFKRFRNKSILPVKKVLKCFKMKKRKKI